MINAKEFSSFLTVVLVSLGVNASSEPTFTNALREGVPVFVNISQEGERDPKESWLVVGGILKALGSWPSKTTVDVHFFTNFIASIEMDKDERAYLNECLNQKTLAPINVEQPRADEFIHDIFCGQSCDFAVGIGVSKTNTITATILVSWQYAGQFMTLGFPGERRQSKPDCQVKFTLPNGLSEMHNCRPTTEKSYQNWPIKYWSRDIVNFISELSGEFRKHWLTK